MGLFLRQYYQKDTFKVEFISYDTPKMKQHYNMAQVSFAWKFRHKGSLGRKYIPFIFKRFILLRNLKLFVLTFIMWVIDVIIIIMQLCREPNVRFPTIIGIFGTFGKYKER